MAPRRPQAKLEMIEDMVSSKSLTVSQMARAAECSKRSIINISNNIRRFGNVRASPTRIGRRRSITPCMLEALCDYLLAKPGLYIDEMVVFLWDEFRIQVTNSSLERAFTSIGWSKKVAKQRAKEQNADLRDFYLHNLSDFQSYQLIYVDESGCDKRIGFRRTGWSPLGVSPLQVSHFHRDQRYQILPAYCQDGIILSRVFQGSTDATVFEDYIEQLLEHCGRWPEPKSVLVMDNASFHHSPRIEAMCNEAGVKLVYLPPYSPDLNPIEEFFSELKAFVRRNWAWYEEDQEQGFQSFLERCIQVVGARKKSALGHFRHVGVDVVDHN